MPYSSPDVHLDAASARIKPYPEARLARIYPYQGCATIFFELQDKGANNINLVTPDHYIPQIISAIDMARSRNFKLPFVYNCSGYETAEMIQLLDGYIDVYLPEFQIHVTGSVRKIQ